MVKQFETLVIITIVSGALLQPSLQLVILLQPAVASGPCHHGQWCFQKYCSDAVSSKPQTK